MRRSAPVIVKGSQDTQKRHGKDSRETLPADPARRRALRTLAWAVAGSLVAAGRPLEAAAGRRPLWERIDAARKRLDGAVPKEGGIRLDLPGVTQDGSAVPLTVDVDHPMEDDDFVEALYLFAAGNPTPEVADVYFTPLAGRARLSTRIRLNESQTVLALARTSRGEWLAGRREVRVTVSGCLSRDNRSDSDSLMRTRIRVSDRLRRGEIGDVRTLVDHPMETGLREDGEGGIIPERIVNEFRAEFNGEPVLRVRLYRAVSANPYLRFAIAPNESGQAVFHWNEDRGESATESTRIDVI